MNSGMEEEQLSVAAIGASLRDVVRRWYLVFAVAVMAAMAAFVMTDMTYTPRYATSATFVVTAGGMEGNTLQNLKAASNLATVFTEVLNSELLCSKVMEQGAIDQFDGTIQAQTVESTNLLTLTVKGSDPRTVFLVCKAIEEHHRIVTGDILNGAVLEVLKEPTVPEMPANPLHLKRAVAQAAFFGAAVMGVLLGIRSYLQDKIRSRPEADRKLECHVLGELYHEKKYKTLPEFVRHRKKSILICDPLTSFVYTESVHKLAADVERRLREAEKVVMVTSFLENEGKSTVAANLALSLAQKGKKVLLMDCDLRKPACALVLDMHIKTPGVGDVLQGKAAIQNAILRVKRTNLFLLPGRRNGDEASDLTGTSAMQSLLRQVSDLFDYVILDTPPMSETPDAEFLSEWTDGAILVVKQNQALTADLNDAAAVLEKSNAHFLGCVLNDVYGVGQLGPAFHNGTYGSYDGYGYRIYGYGKKGRY